MCGIAGVYGETEAEIEPLLDSMAHRGPDGRAVIHLHNGALGHVRLAIVDVDGGQQPMSTPDGKLWLVCNGEIYNHAALRDQFPDFSFQTDSDSEIILALYQRCGVDAVKHLDGMFAFVLWDGAGVYIARDPLGIKPLYYGFAGGNLHFASEIKALQAYVDRVREFPHGHWYHSAQGFQSYYDVSEIIAGGQSSTSPTVLDIRETLREAVCKRLMADVPVGVFLSGGLDSSIVAAVVAEEMDEVHSFNVSFAEGGEDRHYAQLVSQHLGTTHHEYVYSCDEMVEALPEVIYHLESFDPLLVRSAIPNYFLARLASEHVTVVLAGEGADELMTGYHYLKGFESQADLQAEMVRITDGLHDCNLQRLDRMTMAHGLEGRVPFLDTSFIAVAAAVDLEQRLFDNGTEGVEKWALRKAFEDDLPHEVVWRKKQKFSAGAGSQHTLAALAEHEISDADFSREGAQFRRDTGRMLTGKEELYYYRVFRQHFGPDVARMVRRWQDDAMPVTA